MGIAARVAERLGLPHPIDGATAVLATTKTRQRERFAAAGVRQPRVFSTRIPTISVPLRRQGARSAGPARPHSRARAARTSPPQSQAAASESRGGGVLVEELIDGPELTVNAVSVDGALRPAHGHRPAPGRAARVRRRPRPRLAERAPDRSRGRGGARPRSRRSGSRTGRATRRSGSARTGSRMCRGRGAARRRPRRRALPRRPRRRPQRPRAVVRSRRADRL